MRYTVVVRLLAAATVGLVTASEAEAASGTAPGAPGARALWTAGNKDGFGTSTTLGSKVWYTLNGGELTEVYYPISVRPRCVTCSSWSPMASRGWNASARAPGTR